MVELVAVVLLLLLLLLLLPSRAVDGAILTVGVMAGAIFSHLNRLGTVVQDDGVTLFILAVVTLVSAVGVLFIRRAELPVVGGPFRRKE